jgi:uncharacterized protein YukE
VAELMWGADVEALERLADDLQDGARQVEGVRARLAARVRSVAWTGRDGEAFRGDWEQQHARRFGALAQALAAAAEDVRRNSGEQKAAGAAAGGALGTGHGPAVGATTGPASAAVADAHDVVTRALDTGGWSVTRSDLADVRGAVEGLSPSDRAALVATLTPEQVAVLRDQMQESRLKGGWSHAEQASFFQLFADQPDALRTLAGQDAPVPVPDTEHDVRFRGPADVAVHGLVMDGVRGTKDEITVVARDDGSYVVHLPGVTDLTTGLEKGALVAVSQMNPGALPVVAAEDWNSPNASDSPRDMRWARESALAGDVSGGSWENPYTVAVRMALQHAGAPPGATVVLTGHSFGAYTAMELAADRTFNTTDGTGYDVAAVVAMGADVDWRMDDMPPNTAGLVINNTNDVAFRSEAGLSRNPDESAVPSNWREVEFDGGTDGAGHGLPNYVEWINAHPDELPAELGSDVGGTSVQYAVHDVYR